MTELESILGIKFTNKHLLEEAITHKSYAIEKNKPYWNERLEFLGDSVLSCVVADYLYSKFPDSPEGHLSRIKSQLVSRQMLVKLAKELNLGKFILLSKGEESTGGRTRESNLANAVEAIIGAIYLDKGFEMAKKFILKHIPSKQFSLETDYKSKLQEISQAKYKILPVYRVVSENGPEHDKNFIVEVKIKNKILGIGKGKSKKEAEQQAAKEAIQKLKSS
ncbi:MAG: ribonuclease III [Endomicrobiia bacterium]